MKSALLVIPFLLVGLVPVAFGQVVETTGQNYDLIEDYNIGEAKWTSHPERIMVNGEWENYFLQANDQQIIFRSNSVGGFIYDIPSCSYSIYENGFNGNQIIPSVSSVASYNVNGQWQNMAVNQEECLVNFSQGDNGIFITSTKTLFGETNQPIFFSYNGTGSTVNVNGTSYNVISNGNQTGYYVDNFVPVETEKFVQELKVDIFGGIKETFKVWNESNEPLGISQTVHTGESITIGENTLNIAELNGQSFSKQFLEDNQAQVFEIANNLNYDFDLGFDSLSNVNIFFDGNYKVNLDYASGDFVNYLEIDPTFSSSSSSLDGIIQTALTTGTSCNLNTVQSQPYSRTSQYLETYLYASSLNQVCYLPFVMFDVSSIPSSATVTDSVFKYEVDLVLNPRNIDIVGVTADTGSTDQQILTAFGSATTLVSNESGFTSVGANKSVDLTSNGDSYIQNKISTGDEVVFLFPFNSMTRDGSSHVVNFVSSDNTGSTRQKPTLEVTYTVPTAPQPPTNLQTVTGIPIEVSWTAPVDDGGSSLTGYKVYRTLNQYVMTELPNNGGTTPVDFTDNELLLHGESFGGQPDFDDDLSSYTTQAEANAVWETWRPSRYDVNLSTDEIDVNVGIYDSVRSTYNTPYIGSTNCGVCTDLGLLDDNQWVIRFKTSDNTWTTPPYYDITFYWVVSDSSNNMQSSQDVLGMAWRNNVAGGAYAPTGQQTGIVYQDGSNPWTTSTGGIDQTFTTLTTGQTYYHQLTRESATSFKVEIFSDSEYSTSIRSTTVTIPSTIQNLQWLKFLEADDDGNGGGFRSKIDDVKVWNGVNSVPTPTATDNSPNTLTVTANSGTTTTGVISNAISTPNLSVTSSILPDGTDSFTVGSWVKQTLIRDSTLDGTNNGATTGQTGKIDSYAWSFDGSNDYVQLGTTTSDFNLMHEPNGKWSTSFWYKTSSLSTAPVIFDNTNSQTGSGIMIQLQSDGKIKVGLHNAGSQWDARTLAGVAQADGNWHIVTITMDLTLSSNNLSIYHDNGTPYVVTKSGSQSSGSAGSVMRLGSYSGNGAYYNGLLDQVLIYDKVLTSSEVSALYNSGSGDSTPDTNGLIAHYDFEQTGTTLENQIFNPPTNTKLFGFTNSNGDDVVFNVGTTTADFVKDGFSAVFTEDYSTNSGWTQVGTLVTVNSGYSGAVGSINAGSSSDQRVYKSLGTTLGTDWIMNFEYQTPSGYANSVSAFPIYVSTGNEHAEDSGDKIGVFREFVNVGGTSHSLMVPFFKDGSNSMIYSTLSTGIDMGAYTNPNSGTWYYFTLTKSGNTLTLEAFTDSARTNQFGNTVTLSNSNLANVSGLSYLQHSPIKLGGWPNGDYWTIDNTSIGSQATISIISATGLSDNTSDFQHYALSRDGSSWTLYQNGQSVATATDSTDLGSASGQTSLVYDQQTNNNNQSLYNGVQHISAERFGTGSSIVGQKITNVSLLLAIHSGSPTGTATVGAFDSNGNTLFTFDTIDVTTLTGTPTWYDFTNNSGYTVQTDDYIGIKYTGGDSNNRINTFLDYLNNPFEGTTSYWGRYAVTTWQDYTTSDLAMKLTATNDPVYSINLDGSIDEYFIDSTALTSNEIETVYGMGSEPTQIATTGTTPEYDDSGVTGGNTYYYYVKSTNAIGDSGFSTQATGLAGTPPDAPTGLSASIQNTNTAPRDIFLQWSAPTNVGSGTLTGFEIWRDGSLVTTVGLISSYVDIVPTVGTYTYTVKAVSTHGTSVDSNSAQITTPNVPDAPQGLTLSIDNPNPSPLTVTVTVSPPLNDGGSAVTGYNIYTSTDDITYTLQASNTSNPTNITVASAGLWYFKAEAVNGVGAGALSSNAIIGTPNVPDAPTSVTTNIPDVNNAPSSVVVAWSNGLTNGGSAITGYNVYRDGSLLTSLGTGIFTYTDTATKTASTSYTYEVRITNNVGESLGTQSSITTPSPPNAPVLSVETGTTKATWTVPTSDATITNYKLYRDGSLVATVSGSTTTYIDRTLITFGNSYDYQVSAVSSIGEGTLSNTVTTTPDTNVDDATAFGTTGTSSIIDWTEPPYFQGEVTSYSVYYSTPYSSNPSTLIGTTGNTYLNLYNQLQYDTNYAFMVLVNSPLGNTSVGNVVNATTTENLGIVTYDPTTGADWFDIDAVNQEDLSTTKYTRVDNGDTVLLEIEYPTNYEDMTCDVGFKFGQQTLQYIEGVDMTATALDAEHQAVVMQFNNQGNEVITVECADQNVPNSASSYTVTTTFGNFPLLTQIADFRTGEYGTNGMFGALDLITLFVVIISMVGFNRINPIAGVILGVSAITGLAYFGVINLPPAIVGIFALLAFLAWGVTRK